jgi:hypothetical protein
MLYSRKVLLVACSHTFLLAFCKPLRFPTKENDGSVTKNVGPKILKLCDKKVYLDPATTCSAKVPFVTGYLKVMVTNPCSQRGVPQSILKHSAHS